MTYRIFVRTCKNFEEFSRAKKSTIDWASDADEARRICRQYNDDRTPAQIAAGTKAEFERQ